MTKEETFGEDFVLSARASYRSTINGGNRSMGCMAKYEARAVARTKVMLAPWEALAMAVRMKRLVRADVERAMHVATVKGLKRKLFVSQYTALLENHSTYPAATAALLHFKSFRGEANSRVTDAKPVSATWANAFALSRSTTV
jgi:hypothetical protein